MTRQSQKKGPKVETHFQHSDFNADFQPISFTQRELPVEQSTYHVYKPEGDYIEVAAESAYEALAKSGIRQAASIRRFSTRRLSILSRELLQVLNADQPINIAQPANVAEDEAVEGQLSDQDVEQLLSAQA